MIAANYPFQRARLISKRLDTFAKIVAEGNIRFFILLFRCLSRSENNNRNRTLRYVNVDNESWAKSRSIAISKKRYTIKNDNNRKNFSSFIYVESRSQRRLRPTRALRSFCAPQCDFNLCLPFLNVIHEVFISSSFLFESVSSDGVSFSFVDFIRPDTRTGMRRTKGERKSATGEEEGRGGEGSTARYKTSIGGCI